MSKSSVDNKFSVDEGAQTTLFGEAMRSWRKLRRMNLQQVADAAGCAKSYLSMIENGFKANPPSDELIARLEWAMRVPKGELLRLAHWQSTPAAVRRQIESLEARQKAAVARLRELLAHGTPGGDGGIGKAPSHVLDDLWRSGKLQELIEQLGGEGPGRPRDTHEAVEREGPVSRIMPVEVPLINSVAAGYPTDFTDLGYPARVADSYVRSPDIRDPDAFACRVVGDSMTPDYREGDIVVFSPARPVVSGSDCFVRLEPNHETTFKRVFFEDAEGRTLEPGRVRAAAGVPAPDTPVTHIRLHALNSRYPSRVLAREEVSGLYVAVSVTRKV